MAITRITPIFRSRKRPILIIVVLLLIATSTGGGLYRFYRPIPPLSTHVTLQLDSELEQTAALAWPTYAQASIGSVEDGVLASKPNQIPKPTASTAKLITVLAVLRQKPLVLGEKGPVLTIDQRDIDLYNNYFAAGGSLVSVQLGEQLSQYQMLQGILIRSGNNLADSLAIWAFGSLSEYQKAAQKMVNELGMTNTTIGTDASGLSPTTTSTAEDLTKLAVAAMKHEVVREIVRQTSSNLPVDGSKPNTNWMLGQNGVVGIKTGNIPQVGGVFVIASEYAPEGEKPITLVGAVQGETTTYNAIAEAGRLMEATKPLFTRRTLVKKGTVVATVSSAWGANSAIVTAEDISLFGWKYAKLEPKITLGVNSPFAAQATLGELSVGDTSSPLVASSVLEGPSWQWRLLTDR